MGADTHLVSAGGDEKRGLRGPRHDRRRRGSHSILHPAEEGDGADPLPDADEFLPRLRKRDDRPPCPSRSGDPRPPGGAHGGRGRLLPGSSIRQIDLRSPFGRCRRLLRLLEAAHSQHAAEVALLRDWHHLAVSTRPVTHRLARESGLRVRRCHRPRSRRAGHRSSQAVLGCAHRIAP